MIAVAGGAALACVAAAAVADVRHFEIPDRWSILIAALFVVSALFVPPASAFWLHLAAGAGMFLAGALLFSKGWLGGGDVKLLAACAVWTGFDGLAILLAGTALTGGALAVGIVAARRLAGPEPAYRGLQRDGPLPYAIAILGGATAYAVSLY